MYSQLKSYFKANWYDAKKFCIMYGGHLVAITGTEENLQLHREVYEICKKIIIKDIYFRSFVKIIIFIQIKNLKWSHSGHQVCMTQEGKTLCGGMNCLSLTQIGPRVSQGGRILKIVFQ